MQPAQAYQQYKQTQVTTASQGELIVMAYEGALRWLARAQAAFEQEPMNIEAVHNSLVKAQAIVSELQSALRLEEGGEVAENLNRLYEFILDLLTDANIRKDPVPAQQAAELLRELHDAWVQVVRPARPAPALQDGPTRRGFSLSM